MKIIYRLFILVWAFFAPVLYAQLRICSWNIANLGKSKTIENLKYIVKKIRPYDIIAIQELSTGLEGDKTIIRIDSLLKASGGKWDYRISDPTQGAGTERYVFFWNMKRVKLISEPTLIQSLVDSIDREPFMSVYVYKRDTFNFLNFHAVPTAKKPAKEIIQLYGYVLSMAQHRWICMGDFNLTFVDKAYQSWIDLSYLDAVNNLKTSLKIEEKEGERFANSYDHILYQTDKTRLLKGGIVDITLDFTNLRECRKISDHVPVFAIVKAIR